jgi:hypothetical protein
MDWMDCMDEMDYGNGRPQRRQPASSADTPKAGSSIPSIPSMPYIKSIYAGLSANATLVLIGVAIALLGRQGAPLRPPKEFDRFNLANFACTC